MPRVARRKLDELLVVGAVHGQEEIEAGEIVVRRPAARFGPRCRCRDCAPPLARAVGRLADMPIAETGRVDVEEIEHALLLGDAAEDALGHGRAADIAEADEEKAVFGHAG